MAERDVFAVALGAAGDEAIGVLRSDPVPRAGGLLTSLPSLVCRLLYGRPPETDT